MQRKEQEKRYVSQWGKGKRILSCFLSLLMVLSLLPGVPGRKVSADGGAYSSYVNTTTIVKFNDMDWYIIADNSTAVDAGTVTLLAKNPIASSKFHDSSNTYSSSDVKRYLDGLTGEGGSFASVASAIHPVTLPIYQYGSTNIEETIPDAKLYLLSTEEANNISTDVQKCSQASGANYNYWWLRSPGGNDRVIGAACVGGEYGNVDDDGFSVGLSLGVRPALQLNLSSVLFSSESKTFTVATGPTAKENLVYDGTEQELVTAGGSGYLYSLTETSGYSTELPKGKNAGSYTVYYKENANAAAKSLTVEIAKKEVTVAGIAVKDKVYDGTTSAVLDDTNVTYQNGSVDALASGDTLTVTATGTFADANVGDSKTVTISALSLGGASVGNYILAANGNQTSATGKITKKAVTITAKAQTIEVNGTIATGVGEVELSGAVEGHTLSAVTLTAGDVATVGSSTVTPSAATIKSGDTDVTGNYEITYTAGTLTVKKIQPKLKLDTTLTTGTLTYGQALSGSTVTGTMVNPSNEQTEVTGTFAWKEPATMPQVSDSGVTEYAVLFTPTSTEYGAVELKACVTVQAKELTVKAEDKTRMAGASSNPPLTYTVTGLVGTDTKEAVFEGALACAANSSSPAGQTYDITQGTLAVKNGNYTLGTFTKGILTISQAEREGTKGKITVNVKKDAAMTATNPTVVVSVERGNDVIASQEVEGVTTVVSTANFENLPDGNYNVVVRTKEGDFTETKLLSIRNGEAVTAEFTVLQGKIAAVVEIKEGTDTPKVAVDGLNDILDDTDKVNAANGITAVEVKLDVEKKLEWNAKGSTEIKGLLSSREEIETYLDFSLLKTVTDLRSGTKGTSVDIGSTNTNILCIAIPYVFSGRSGFFLARYHGNRAERMSPFTEKPTGEYSREGYYLDRTAGYIFLYAKGFSTYAIGYEKTESSTSSSGGGFISYLPKVTPTPSPSASAEASESPSASVAPSVEPSENREPTSSEAPDTSMEPESSEESASSTELIATVSAEEKKEAMLALNAGLQVVHKGTRVTVQWGKVEGADFYRVYAAYCGSKWTLVKTGSASKCKVTIQKLNGKKLSTTKNLKVYVAVYRTVETESRENAAKKEVRIAKTIVGHVVGKQNKTYSNAKNIKLSKSSYSLKKGKKVQIQANTILEYPKRKQLSDAHAKEFRYASSDKNIATVDKKGKVTAKKKGNCMIYVYARNGLAEKITVTVKY